MLNPHKIPYNAIIVITFGENVDAMIVMLVNTDPKKQVARNPIVLNIRLAAGCPKKVNPRLTAPIRDIVAGSALKCSCNEGTIKPKEMFTPPMIILIHEQTKQINQLNELSFSAIISSIPYLKIIIISSI